MNNIQSFKESLQVSDQLLKIASKEDIAECARLLAFNIAHYQTVHGDLDVDETLIGVLGGIVQGFEDKTNQ